MSFRVYLYVWCLPFMLFTTFVAFYVSAFFLIFNHQQHPSIDILRTLLAFNTQQIRNTFIFVILERIYATIKLEKHSLKSDCKTFCSFTVISFLASLLFMSVNIYSKFTGNLLWNSYCQLNVCFQVALFREKCLYSSYSMTLFSLFIFSCFLPA